MRRYRHYLSKAKGNHWPHFVYCVSVGRKGPVYVKRLMLRGDCYESIESEQLDDATQWAGYLAYHARRGSESWLLSCRCPHQWSQLRVYEGIENGQIIPEADTTRRAEHRSGNVRSLRTNGTGETAVEGRAHLPIMRRDAIPLIVTEDPPCILRFGVRGEPGIITWVDSNNYGFGVDNAIRDPLGCNDAIALFWQRMYAGCQELRFGSARTTVSSQAFGGWRNSYLCRGIYCHNDPDALEIEEGGYYGGRAECFRLGRIPGQCTHFDIRSSYGAILASEKLPIRLVGVFSGAAAEEQCRKAVDIPAIADVTVETEEPAYPYVRDGVTIWPVGRFRTILPGPELVDALLQHRIVRCHRIATYQSAPVCREFARSVYGYRLRCSRNGDVGGERWSKRLLVSLAGKFGQRNRVWVEEAEPGTIEPYGEWYGDGPDGEPCRYRSIGGRLYREIADGFAPDAVPATASWITSAARMALLRLIRIAEWRTVVYADTDAVIVMDEGAVSIRNSEWSIGEGMGQLRIVSEEKDLAIYGIKHYREGNKTTFAGLPHGSISDCGDGEHYWYMPSPSEEIKSGNRPQATPELRSYPSHATYVHGVVGSGGKVKPIRIGGRWEWKQTK